MQWRTDCCNLAHWLSSKHVVLVSWSATMSVSIERSTIGLTPLIRNSCRRAAPTRTSTRPRLTRVRVLHFRLDRIWSTTINLAVTHNHPISFLVKVLFGKWLPSTYTCYVWPLKTETWVLEVVANELMAGKYDIMYLTCYEPSCHKNSLQEAQLSQRSRALRLSLKPWNEAQRSLKVIKSGTIRKKLKCGFLFAFCSNCDCIFSRFRDIQRQIMVPASNNVLLCAHNGQINFTHTMVWLEQIGPSQTTHILTHTPSAFV